MLGPVVAFHSQAPSSQNAVFQEGTFLCEAGRENPMFPSLGAERVAQPSIIPPLISRDQGDVPSTYVCVNLVR